MGKVSAKGQQALSSEWGRLLSDIYICHYFSILNDFSPMIWCNRILKNGHDI